MNKAKLVLLMMQHILIVKISLRELFQEKIIIDQAYKIARNSGYDKYQKALASMVYTFFDKKTELGISVNEWVEELHKPLIKKFKRRNVYARFKDYIWAADLAEMGSLSLKNKNVKYLLCVIDVFTKYACVEPLKDLQKKDKTVFSAFIDIVNESNRKPNKSWVDQRR